MAHPAHKPQHNINLFQNRGKGFIDKFLDWALSIGRILIIVTELIALGVFASRFYYDNKLTDLHDQIKQKQIVLSYLQNDETQDRNLQNRLSIANTLMTNQKDVSTLLKQVLALAPANVTITQTNLSNNKIGLTALAYSIAGLSQFTTALKDNNLFTNISVDSIKTETAKNDILVQITLTLNSAKLP